MAFDAAMMHAVVHELSQFCSDGGARTEKVLMPQTDEVVLLLHIGRETRRFAINAGSNSPRMSFTSVIKENPPQPPMFCMLLRKHLTGAVLVSAEQAGFERVARLRFRARDEMGFEGGRVLICEIMGKYSNLILTDESSRILGVLRAVDFTTSHLRQVLPGMTYEMPPAQEKRDPMAETEQGFLSLLGRSDGSDIAEKWICRSYLGTSSQAAREMVWRCAAPSGALLSQIPPELFCRTFLSWFGAVRQNDYTPTLVSRPDGTPLDYSHTAVHYLGDGAVTEQTRDFGELFDRFFSARDREQKMALRSADLHHLISKHLSRLTKKAETQRRELAEAMQADIYRKYGDLIIANIYRIKRGEHAAVCTDWEASDAQEVTVPLDVRLNPSSNAQKYYKMYNKAKTARKVLVRQIAQAESELSYLDSVSVFLENAETESDLAGIREELTSAGYIKSHKAGQKKPGQKKPRQLTTPGGYPLYVGTNNLENEYITFKLASRDDLWFHVKGMPGSHVVMCCGTDEPSAADYTFAATVAAHYSRAQGKGTAVDYTRIRELKRVPGAHAGYVIYHTNHSAYVDPADFARLSEVKDK